MSRFLAAFILSTIAAYLYLRHQTNQTNMAAARISRSVIKKVYAVETPEVSFTG